MRTLEFFYEVAQEDFKKAGIGGNLQGIKVKDGKVYFLHNFPIEQEVHLPHNLTSETLWEEALKNGKPFTGR